MLILSVSEIGIVTSTFTCVQISIFEARWSNSLSTSSSVYVIVAFPYSTASGKVSSLSLNTTPSDDSFPDNFEFLCQLLLTYPVFCICKDVYLCYYLFLCAICISQYFSLSLSSLSLSLSLSLCSFHCSSSTRHVINQTYFYSVTCGHHYNFSPSFFCLSLFSSFLSHYHFFQQILAANNLLLFLLSRTSTTLVPFFI